MESLNMWNIELTRYWLTYLQPQDLNHLAFDYRLIGINTPALVIDGKS